MQAFHFHGNLVHDIGHNLLIIAILLVQQLGIDNVVAIVRRHA